MSVKSQFTFRSVLNISHIYFAVAALFIVTAVNLFDEPNEKLIQQQSVLAMRAIGDGLLKHDNDYSTPVPPIESISQATLRLEFDNPIAIDPNHLVDLFISHLTPEISLQSIVTVLDADTEQIVYGFEINHQEEMDIPCLGRILPKANYLLEVNFYDQTAIQLGPSIVPSLSLAGASFLFTLFGFSLLKRKKSESGGGHHYKVNGIKLDLGLSQVIAKGARIQLTDKECQLLAILMKHAGKLVTRERLLDEVWLQKGVVTSRSLDMYISRLRKKMEVLPNVEIANQHGKGYVLRIV
jgi:hypothetical protein